jgi:PASTA domain-containing protein
MNRLQANQKLNVNDQLVSNNGKTRLIMQADGNLVLYRNDGKALWASDTWGKPVNVAIMQDDGNFVCYAPGVAYWSTDTWGHPGAYVILQDDGNLVVYSSSNSPLWASNTVWNWGWPWAIILCKFSDKPAEPRPPAFYQDFYTKHGTGGVCDYWQQVSFSGLDLTSSQVFGWFTMNHASSELANLHFPADRSKLVQWGIDTANANQVDLSCFKTILVVQNYGVDHGFAGNGVVIIHSDPNLIEFGFICHEMGHGFGLPHSFAANPDTEYGNGWDIMSWDTATSVTSDFAFSFEGANGTAGPGLNARNVEGLSIVPPGATWNLSNEAEAAVTLHALNQPYAGSGYLVAEIPRSSNSTFTVEYRHKDGPDRGIQQDVVLVNEIRADGLSYLQPGWNGHFVAGDQFTIPSPPVTIKVVNIDSGSKTATVKITQEMMTTVPNVIRLSPAEALARIQHARLNGGVARTIKSQGVDTPTVAGQSPGGGTGVAVGTWVSLFVEIPATGGGQFAKPAVPVGPVGRRLTSGDRPPSVLPTGGPARLD